MNQRSTERIYKPGPVRYVGDGFRVHNFIPGKEGLTMQRMDPFLMLDYNAPYQFPPSADKPRGVGVHPHRGFETVTIAYKGRIAHRDNSGGGGVIAEGDVQWMTAGSGILHEEFHETEWSKTGGEFHMVQLWVNLPKKHKSTPPKYQAIKAAEIPQVQLPGGGLVGIIAGEYNGSKGVAETFTPVQLYNISLSAGKTAPFEFPASYNTALLVLYGEIVLGDGPHCRADELALLDNDGNSFHLRATENTQLLLMSAEPLREPIAARGPFVMNTEEELRRAYADYRNGKFGEM